jgi:hypothetical protein
MRTTKLNMKTTKPNKKKIPERLVQNVLLELDRLFEQKLLAETARKVGLPKQRLTDFRTGRLPITEYYLNILVKGGAVTRDTLLRGRDFEKLPEDEQITIFKFTELSDATILKMIRARARGGDIDTLLDSALEEEPSNA